jgi:hypothetical protein
MRVIKHYEKEAGKDLYKRCTDNRVPAKKMIPCPNVATFTSAISAKKCS